MRCSSSPCGQHERADELAEAENLVVRHHRSPGPFAKAAIIEFLGLVPPSQRKDGTTALTVLWVFWGHIHQRAAAVALGRAYIARREG
jgi:hypothetical protein